MTASVGVGKARDIDDAMKYILQLLANLDAKIVTVEDEGNMAELAFFMNKPEERETRPHCMYVCS